MKNYLGIGVVLLILAVGVAWATGVWDAGVCCGDPTAPCCPLK